MLLMVLMKFITSDLEKLLFHIHTIDVSLSQFQISSTHPQIYWFHIDSRLLRIGQYDSIINGSNQMVI